MEYSQAKIKKIAIHYIGNKHNGDELVLSRKQVQANAEISFQIRESLLSRFTNVHEKFQFTHNDSLKFNEVYNFVEAVFSEEQTLQQASAQIAKHLYEQTTHPKIKAGELIVVHIENYLLENKMVDVVGIFKIENKNSFFEIAQEENEFSILMHQGVESGKFDKGCLIFNKDKKSGFQVLILDSQRGEEARYWKEAFLGLTPIANEFHQTNQFLSIAKTYVTKQFENDFEITKADQIDMLNRSVEYFKTHEVFEKKEFEKEVFQDAGIIKSFREFDKDYREDNAIEVEDSFEISAPAVKKQSRVFKSVLKLDKNFHVYIHGDKNLIEHGVEKDGRKFYKIYYNEER